jgi:hypothetical protein
VPLAPRHDVVMSDDAHLRPDQRWDPGARYRPSALVAQHRPGYAVVAPRLDGRLRRGPARRVAVFDRDLWRPVQHVTTGLVRAVGRALAG